MQNLNCRRVLAFAAIIVVVQFAAFAAESNSFAGAAASLGGLSEPAKCAASVSDGRIWITAQINAQPVKLAFDTGASSTVLFRSSAERLGLGIRELPRGAMRRDCPVGMSQADECTLTSPAGAMKIRPQVFNCTPFLPDGCDGVLSWNQLKDSLIEIDMAQNCVSVLSALPRDVNEWTAHKLTPVEWMLGFECKSGTETARIGIDTGSADGVWLSQPKWENWCAAHPGRCCTLDCFSSADDGMVISPVAHARKIALGGIALDDVPVRSFTASEARALQRCDCVLATFALSRLKLIVDAKNGIVYTRPNEKAATSYGFNRVGAVFVRDWDKRADLVAHVTPESPAYASGIRDGDMLLKVGATDVANPQNGPGPSLRAIFCNQPAGTKLHLTLTRNEKRFEADVTLKDVPAAE
ncbi:MAG TPA: aspartyl protease family protein [Planctomycetota bacterium]|nr:aspartyl protease family protein [Planctomycetota bacterium]